MTAEKISRDGQSGSRGFLTKDGGVPALPKEVSGAGGAPRGGGAAPRLKKKREGFTPSPNILEPIREREAAKT